MAQLDRFLAGLAVTMSAATLGAAYLFRFDGGYSAFDRLTAAIGFAFGPWIVAGAVALLIYVGGRLLRFEPPLMELYFALVAGASALALLSAFR
jgi:hypothetical protein